MKARPKVAKQSFNCFGATGSSVGIYYASLDHRLQTAASLPLEFVTMPPFPAQNQWRSGSPELVEHLLSHAGSLRHRPVQALYGYESKQVDYE